MISKLPKWVWAGAAVLAFSAGTVNVIAIMSFTHKATTHMTGIFSLFSIAVFQNDRTGIAQAFFIILAFFSGAVISGIIIRDGQLKMGRRYGFALAVECFLLLLSTYFFVRGSMWGEYLAGMSAGLQNAMASTYSGTIVRTTHLTGVLTDLGALFGNKIHGIDVDSRRVQLLSIIISSFVLGGFVGAFSYHYLGELAMLVPAFTIGFSSIVYEIFRRYRVSSSAA